MAVIRINALANLLFLVYFNNRYGYFRAEFDYMSCGDHLAWGYVDQPPLIRSILVWSGRQACLPKTAGCRMAYGERIVGLD